MGFSRQEYWSGLQCPSPEDLPNAGIEPASLMSSALTNGFFTTRATRKPMSMFRAALLTIAPNWKQPKCSSTGERIKAPAESALQIPGLRIRGFNANQKYLGGKNACLEPSNKQNLNLWYTSNFLHSIYIVLDITDITSNLCVCVCVHAQSCPTLWNPMGYSLLGSSVHGISQARILMWVAIACIRATSRPRDGTCSLLHLQADALPLAPLGKSVK